jgi:hypothetical protein
MLINSSRVRLELTFEVVGIIISVTKSISSCTGITASAVVSPTYFRPAILPVIAGLARLLTL